MTGLQIRTGIDRCTMRRTRGGIYTTRAGIVPDLRATSRTGVAGNRGALAGARGAIDGTRTGATVGTARTGTAINGTRTGTAVNVTGARAVAPGDGGAGSAGRTRDAWPVVRPTAPGDVAAAVAVALGSLAAAHTRRLAAADLRACAAVDAAAMAAAGLGRLAATTAAADTTAAVTAAGLRACAAADAAVVVAAGRRHLRRRPVVPRRGAVLRSRRVGRTTAGTTTLALCLKRGGTHHYDAKHQYHFYESFHFNKWCFR